MNTLKFESDIDSQEAIESLRKILEANNQIQYWHVDLLDPNHLLTVTGENLQSSSIKEMVKQAGFHIKEN